MLTLHMLHLQKQWECMSEKFNKDIHKTKKPPNGGFFNIWSG